MGLAKLIDLILSLFLADDGLSLRVSEALEDALVVQLVFFFLLLLLLELQPHELIFLLGNGSIFHGLALQGVVRLFQLLHDVFELLDPL